MRRGSDPVGLACPACGSGLVEDDIDDGPGGTVRRLACPGCGGRFRATRRDEVGPRPEADRTPPGGIDLAIRVALLRALPPAYRAGVGLGVLAILAAGGAIPVLRGWLGDSIRSGGDVVEALGGVAAASPSRDPDADLGPLLKRADAPGLFDEVAEVARRLGVRPPEEVRLAFLPCCGVVGWRRGRALLVGLPLLDVLSRAELRGVLAHEMAHLARGDATRSARSVRFVEAIGRALDDPAGRPRGPLRWWAMLCRTAGMKLVGPVAEGQEARADRAAATIAGGRLAASGLVKVALVQPLFREVLDLHQAISDGPGTANLYAAFRGLWERLPPALLDAMRLRLLTTAGRAGGSPHPPLGDRVAALMRRPDAAGPPAEPGRAVGLLADPDWLEERLHELLFSTRAVEPSVFHRAGT